MSSTDSPSPGAPPPGGVVEVPPAPGTHQKAAAAFFAFAVGLFGFLVGHSVWRSVTSSAPPLLSQPVDVYELTRTPIVRLGPHRFAIHGLGQDEGTGKQVVWVRRLETGDTAAVGAGQPLPGTEVLIDAIYPRGIRLRRGRRTRLIKWDFGL